MSELAIACTLDRVEARDRAQLIDALAADALLARLPIDGGHRLFFRDGEEVERRLRELVAAESRCCSFLTLSIARRPGELQLDVTGPADARPVIDQFFAVGRGRASSP